MADNPSQKTLISLIYFFCLNFLQHAVKQHEVCPTLQWSKKKILQRIILQKKLLHCSSTAKISALLVRGGKNILPLRNRPTAHPTPPPQKSNGSPVN